MLLQCLTDFPAGFANETESKFKKFRSLLRIHHKEVGIDKGWGIGALIEMVENHYAAEAAVSDDVERMKKTAMDGLILE